jgi:catechol 2,3-dioxygenase-like lactoylglutathione lyase family enzyme
VVVSVKTPDLASGVHFYRDVIGLQLLPDHAHQAAFDLGEGIHLVLVPAQPSLPPDNGPARFPSLAFFVQDLDKAISHLEAHSVDIPWGIEESSQARWVVFRDPAGNLIEFAQLTPPPHSR